MDKEITTKLPNAFYQRSALDVAPELLGKILVRRTARGETAGRIVEVEAYLGITDAASHTYRGRRTGRTEILYGPGGHAYVYLIYGLHHCLNLVTNAAGIPEGVMLRALEPVAGQALMAERRGNADLRSLCRGPGCLCAALDIDRSCCGLDLGGDELFLVDDGTVPPPAQIAAVPRINVDYAGADAAQPWRFLIASSPFLSVKPRRERR